MNEGTGSAALERHSKGGILVNGGAGQHNGEKQSTIKLQAANSPTFRQVIQSAHMMNRHEEPLEPKPTHSEDVENNVDVSMHSINRLDLSSQHRKKSTVSTGRPGPKLSWKSDPKESFCDWRIEVRHAGTNHVDVYNVHRNMIGFGPRKSKYMVKKFMRQMEQRDYGAGSNITEIDLPANQAQAFPMVLDFLYYTQEVKQRLTADRACSVLRIAELLEIVPLQDAIVEFYGKTISLKNMGDFIEAATKANSKKLLLAAKTKVNGFLTEKPELAGLLPPEFLADIMEMRHRNQQENGQSASQHPTEAQLSQSRLWSKAVLACANQHEKMMTRALFERFTKEEYLPAIDVTAAMKLLAMDSKYIPPSKEYTSLQRRCAASITDNWERFQSGFPSPADASAALKKLPSHVLADILVKSLHRSQE